MKTSTINIDLPKLASLWIGPKLGLIEQMTLLSFLEHGYDFTLFTTQDVSGIPAGIRVRDANEIFPCHTILRDRKSNSPALHADMFRYAMLAKTDLTWVDMDVLCIRPFMPVGPYVFAYETDGTVNNAVLRLPPDSPTLRDLLQYQPNTRGYPPFFSFKRRLKVWMKNGFSAPHISRWPWGSIGPQGLTFYLKKNGEIQHALPQTAFYYVRYSKVEMLTQPGVLTRQDLPPEVFYIHLWGKALRARLDRQTLDERSFLGQEKKRLAAAFNFVFNE